MKRRLKKRTSAMNRRAPGQSLVLIALILAILVGLVALSVDVGNAYAEQRAAQRAGDAASVEGMRVLLANGTRGEIYNAVKSSLTGHNIQFVTDPDAPLEPGQRRLKVLLIRGDDGGTLAPELLDSGRPEETPTNVNYVQVNLDGIQATNFAGLVGQGTLPVNANAYASASICPPVPIGIAKDAFTSPQIYTAKGDLQYSDELYTKKQMRRMFLRDDPTGTNTNQNDVNGSFVWLRWNDDTSNFAEAMTAALTPPGTIQSYREADRPESFPNEPDAAVYPDQPGIPSSYDVMYGSQTMKLGNGFGTGQGFNPTGAAASGTEAEVVAQVKRLVEKRSLMNLPEFDRTDGIRENGLYRLSGFGGYMAVGYGYIPENSSWLTDPNGGQDLSRGFGWFIDLVKIGAPQRCASNQSEVFLNDEPITLAGSVKIKPQLSATPSSRKPLDVVVVLDASGSMNWNWPGIGTASDTLINDLTTAKNNNQLPASYVIPAAGSSIDCVELLTLAKGCQSADAYGTYTDRRLFQAKQAVKSFLTGFQWLAGQDRATIITYSGSNNIKKYPTTGLSTNIIGTDNGSVVNQLINEAATIPGNEYSTDLPTLYKTLGASPGASGLQVAKSVLDTQSSGDRERVVIFLTDGLLNVKLNGQSTLSEDISANYDPTWKDVTLPINAAGLQADLIKDQNNSKSAKIYVLALGSQFNAAGLDYMASSKSPPFFDTANSPGALTNLLTKIGTDIIYGDCEPTERPPLVPEASQMVFAKDSPIGLGSDGTPRIGTVTVTDSNGGAVATVDINEDGTFKIPGLQPNTTYRLSFNNGPPIFYQGEDGIPRWYNTISATNSDTLEVRTSSTGIGTTQYVLDGTPVLLLFTGTLCLVGGSPNPLRVTTEYINGIGSKESYLAPKIILFHCT